jgi:hypothetical protein
MFIAGVVGCALTYQDFNVTSVLKVGGRIRVCNGAWSSFAKFDKVAYVNGRILAKADVEEPQAMGLLQILRTVDNSINASWALSYLKSDTLNVDNIIQLPNRNKLKWGVSYSTSTSSNIHNEINVDGLTFQEPDSVEAVTVIDGIRLLPLMNNELLAELLSLPELAWLGLDIGSGSLFPQLAALKNLKWLIVRHYCLRGPLPMNLVANLPDMMWLQVVPKDQVVGASDHAGGLCGLNGTVTHLTRPEMYWPLSRLDLYNNQITGQLPPHLLSLATFVDFSNNKISGSIPGVRASMRLVAKRVKLSGNKLEVSFT